MSLHLCFSYEYDCLIIFYNCVTLIQEILKKAAFIPYLLQKALDILILQGLKDRCSLQNTVVLQLNMLVD